MTIEQVRDFLGTDNVRQKEVPQINGMYYWEPMRGGKQLMVDDKGNMLGATSRVSPQELLRCFIERYNREIESGRIDS